MVGHLDHRRRRAAQLLLRKDASYPVRIVQTGQVQSYALFIVVGAVALFGYYMVAVDKWISTY